MACMENTRIALTVTKEVWAWNVNFHCQHCSATSFLAFLMWCSAYIYRINIIVIIHTQSNLIIHTQSNLPNMTIVARPCSDLRSRCFFVWSLSKIPNKLGLVVKTSKCKGQIITWSMMCCHLVYQITTLVFTSPHVTGYYTNEDFWKLFRTQVHTHTPTYQLCLVIL